jgi:hypothetical protein
LAIVPEDEPVTIGEVARDEVNELRQLGSSPLEGRRQEGVDAGEGSDSPS